MIKDRESKALDCLKDMEGVRFSGTEMIRLVKVVEDLKCLSAS
jgi:hypothetical protein